MRTLITLLALAMVGAAAPVAPHGLQHLSGTLAVFSTAVVAVLGTCLLTGWLRSEPRFARGAVAGWYSRFAPDTAYERATAERLPQSVSLHQAPALVGARPMVQLGEPGESVLLRARTSRYGHPRYGHPVALRDPAGFHGGLPAEEATMQRR